MDHIPIAARMSRPPAFGEGEKFARRAFETVPLRMRVRTARTGRPAAIALRGVSGDAWVGTTMDTVGICYAWFCGYWDYCKSDVQETERFLPFQ